MEGVQLILIKAGDLSPKVLNRVEGVYSIKVTVNGVPVVISFEEGKIRATCRNRFLEFDDGLDPFKGNIK